MYGEVNLVLCRKKLSPLEEQTIFRVLTLKGIPLTGMQTGSHKIYIHLQKMAAKTTSVPIHLKVILETRTQHSSGVHVDMN